MNAIPEGSKQPRFDTIADPEYPQLKFGSHLIDYAFKFKEISYTEIKSWCEITRTPLAPWEAEAMMIIRSKYDAMSDKATKKDCPAPYCTVEQREATLNDQFASLWSAAK